MQTNPPERGGPDRRKEHLSPIPTARPPPLFFFAHIGGLQKVHARAMGCFCANVNSYRRLTRYLSSPINVHWGYDNRTAGLRVPMSDAQARRVENRVRRRGRQSLYRHRRLARLWLPRHGRGGAAERSIVGSAHDLPFGLPRSLDEACGRCAPASRW